MALNRGPTPSWKKKSSSWNQPWKQQSSAKHGSSWNQQSPSKGKGKGKGKGKAKGEGQGLHGFTRQLEQTVETVVDRIMREHDPSWKQQSSGKGEGKSKGKGKGNAEATAEQEEQATVEQATKHALYVSENPREMTDVETTGRFKRRVGTHGWILLDWPHELSPELKTKIDEMCSRNAATIKEKGGRDRLFSSHVVFLHNSEMQKNAAPPNEGDELRFKLYTDNQGVGATEIEITEKAKRQRWPRFAHRGRW